MLVCTDDSEHVVGVIYGKQASPRRLCSWWLKTA